MRKYLIALTLLGAVSVQAEETTLNLSSSQEQSQSSEIEKQEALMLQAQYEVKRVQTAEAREHEKVLRYIDRHDRN